MAQQTMYSAKLGSPQTTLAATLAADATSMVLTDASVLPAGPNIAVLGVDENCEIVKYTAIDSTTNTVSGLVRAQGGSTAKVWEAGSVVARNATSLDHDLFKANIEDLETRKSDTDHVHDGRYYTESEMDTKLAAKQNSLTFDSTPTSGSTNPVTSGGVKTYVDNKVLYYSTGGSNAMAVNAATNTQIGRIPASGTDSKITTNTVVLSIVFANPSAITSNVSWTSYAGYITFSGTCTSATTANVILGVKGN